MRNKLFVIGILLCSNITHAQQRIAGLNKDIHVTKVGVKPYEMKNTSLKKATLSFMDCSKWYVQTENCEAALYRSNQEIVADEFSGKVRLFIRQQHLKHLFSWGLPSLWN